MNILYITYDGMLDPLGESQILPYIAGISSHSKCFTVLSFEKDAREHDELEKKERQLKSLNINWKKRKFTSGNSIFFKVYDLIKIYLSLFILLTANKFDVVHARGLPCASTCLFFKKIFKFKLIFDFRGLWADERITKGGWDINKFFHRMQYQYYKNQEKELFLRSEKIVVLTNTVLNDLKKRIDFHPSKVTVIPCASDFEHFNILANQASHKESLVLGYLGSIGPMYQFSKFLELLEVLQQHNKEWMGLIITNDISLAKYEVGLSNVIDCKIKIISSARSDIPTYLNQMSFLVSFYSNSYSVISVSPTKIGEALACGVPVICNSGIGDTDAIINKISGGEILQDTSPLNLKKAASSLKILSNQERLDLRSRAREYFDLKLAIEKYSAIYDSL